MCKEFKAIWNYFTNGPNDIKTASNDEIRNFAIRNGLVVEDINEITDYSYLPLPFIELKTDKGTAVFPRGKLNTFKRYTDNISPTQKWEQFWRSVDWFLPIYQSNGHIKIAIELTGLNPTNSSLPSIIAQEKFEPALSCIYNTEGITHSICEQFPLSPSIKKHLPIIKESVLAFYSGMRIVAISSLIPIVEDILRSTIDKSQSEIDTVAKVNHSINKAQNNLKKIIRNNADWIPAEFEDPEALKTISDPYFGLELIRTWLTNSFYGNDSNYNNHSGFNRHIFAHAKSSVWQNTNNFFRAIGLIEAMAFVEQWAIGLDSSCKRTSNTDADSTSFKQEINLCLALQQAKRDLAIRLQIENNLPFNITASDDGWISRSKILAEKMDSEIVFPLKSRGWQCHAFSEPSRDEGFEHVTVEARKDSRNIKIALIYTPSIGKHHYELLNQTCNFIIYPGPFYKMTTDTSNINADILPLNAWIPPD